VEEVKEPKLKRPRLEQQRVEGDEILLGPEQDVTRGLQDEIDPVKK